MKQSRFQLLITGAISFCIFFFILYKKSDIQFFKSKISKPNILIVSVCSMRLKNLGLYGYRNRSTTPKIDSFFSSGSLVFDRMFNTQSWTALSAVTQTHISKQFFMLNGYNLLGYRRENQSFRIPGKVLAGPNTHYSQIVDRNFDKDHRGYFKYLKTKLLQDHQKPFFVIAHLKYLHYPLIDRFNSDSQWDIYLNADEKQIVDNYLQQPQQYPDKLPIQLFLKNQAKYIQHQPEFSESKVEYLRPMLGLISNKALLQKWQASPGFDRDLEIIQKIYDANLLYLDKKIGDILNLYGDKSLQDNTIVVLTGDHGEPLMEHGHLSHGASVYDEEFSIPFAVKFPTKNSKTLRSAQQFYLGDFAEVLKGLIRGQVGSENFLEQLKQKSSDVVIGRNCSNNQYMIRIANQWKWTYNIETNEQMLFDLKSDPFELMNVADQHPEQLTEMESRFWATYPSWTRPSHEFCAPWIQ